jgi:hypothetical protein
MDGQKPLNISELQKKDLTIYYFITKKIIPPNMSDKVDGIVVSLAYDLDTALKTTIKIAGDGAEIKVVGNQSVKDFLSLVNKENDKQPTQAEIKPPEQKKLMALENFKTSILYAADRYVENELDRKKLKVIITKMKRRDKNYGPMIFEDGPTGSQRPSGPNGATTQEA